MATLNDILKAYKSSINAVLSDIDNSRLGQTVSGGAKNSLASDVNAGATIYVLTQDARDTMMSTYVSDSANSLKAAKQALAQLEQEGASAWEIENQQTVVNSLQRQYDAMAGAALYSAARRRRPTSSRTIREGDLLLTTLTGFDRFCAAMDLLAGRFDGT